MAAPLRREQVRDRRRPRRDRARTAPDPLSRRCRDRPGDPPSARRPSGSRRRAAPRIAPVSCAESVKIPMRCQLRWPGAGFPQIAQGPLPVFAAEVSGG
ncbi:hypothetical protein SGPA1_20047 [Streptomyces misionensis JCM 4497]